MVMASLISQAYTKKIEWWPYRWVSGLLICSFTMENHSSGTWIHKQQKQPKKKVINGYHHYTWNKSISVLISSCEGTSQHCAHNYCSKENSDGLKQQEAGQNLLPSVREEWVNSLYFQRLKNCAHRTVWHSGL